VRIPVASEAAGCIFDSTKGRKIKIPDKMKGPEIREEDCGEE
jgi:hypothetical protein